MTAFSVIIPVYNAAAYVTQAVESALAQPETGEVLLIEDGSLDDSLAVCQALAEKHPQVKLLRHPNGENKGAGASRNLGMEQAGCDWMAFLDADDYYLPGRFTKASEIFMADQGCAGVYEAIGRQVEDGEGLHRWDAAGKSDQALHTMSKEVPPEDLPDALISNQYGSFHLDGLTIRRSLLAECGLMNQRLRLHQDTDFIIRCALSGKLLPGRLDVSVAVWRVHAANRISAPRSAVKQLDDRMAMWESLYGWCKRKGLSHYRKVIMHHMVINVISEKRFTVAHFPRKILRLWGVFKWLLHRPGMVIDRVFWRTFLRIVKGA